MSRQYILYDGRAVSGNTDDASVYEMCDTLKEAKKAKREDWPDAVCYSYAVNGTTLTDEQFEF